jgi:hypothetical protein
MIRWSTSTELVFHFGVLGQVAYLADPAKQAVGLWPFLAIVLVPYLLLLCFRRGELRNETVERAHLLAALWYLALSAAIAVQAARGYRPAGWIFFLGLIAPGALISLLMLLRRSADPPAPTSV